MLYGERLKIAIERRSAALGREISKSELARAIGCSPQNISMILSHARGDDQKLSSDRHTKAANFLRVNPHWLATEEGAIDLASNQAVAPADTAQAAINTIAPDMLALIQLVNAIPLSVRRDALLAASQVLIGYLLPASVPATVEQAPAETQASTPG